MRRLLAVLLLLSACGFAQTTCVNCGGGAYASGGQGTSGTLLKGDGAGFGADSSVTEIGTNSERIGAANNATPAAATVTCGESSRGGTDSNVAGGACTIQSGDGTGTAGGGSIVFKTGIVGGSGTTADTQTTALTIDKAQTSTFTGLVIPVASSSATVVGGIGTASNGSGINFQATQLQFITTAARNAALAGSIFSLGNAGIYGWSNTSGDAVGSSVDTNISKASSGVVQVGTTVANSAGTLNAATFQYRGLAQTTFVTGDFTTSGSGTALEAITGLTWTFPASTAINARVDCNILYNQNVGTAAVAFGWQDATIAPTNLAASGFMYTSATASTEGTVAASVATTAVSLVSATPSVITTIWHAQLHFLIEQPSNASTSAFTIRVSTATAADTVTVKRGSYCSLAQ